MEKNKRLKLLPSTDYTFCKSKLCEKADICSRNLKHYSFRKEVSFSTTTKTNYKNCNLFWDGRY